MKKLYGLFACGALCATGALAAIALPRFSMSDVNLGNLESAALPAEGIKGKTAAEIVKRQAPLREAAADELPACVTVETVVDENFDLWIKGTNEIPDSEQIDDDDDFLQTMMSYPGDWILFDVYQAGKAAYLGFDEVGDNGPGYISTPTFDVTGDKVAYRLRVTAMNVNPDAQNQNLQVFFLNEETSTFASASAQPFLYKEWSTLEWVGKTDTPKLRAMIMGWQGKVLIDNITFDRLVYPLATPTITSVTMEDLDKAKVKWNAVEGATSYVVNMTVDGEVVGTTTVENATEGVVEMTIEPDATYVAEVIAYNGDDCSYPAHKGAELAPASVGKAVALEATEVGENGFTANWERAANAAQYMIFPTVNHTAVENESSFMLLQDTFQNVPESNDPYNPALVSPMLGMGNINRYMGCAGWTTDFCIFMRLTPEMPALVLTNTYAAYGMPGFVMSPAYDLSVGGGNVTISGMGLSAEDDVVLTAYLVDAATQQPYASADMEVSPMGDMFQATITGGKANSCIMLVITDSADEDMVLVPFLNISVGLNAGESITAPLPTVVTEGPVASYAFDYPVDENNSYTYSVQGMFGNMVGSVSNSVEVNYSAGADMVASDSAQVFVEGNDVVVLNPEGLKVVAFAADGRQVAASSEASFRISGVSGLLVVKVGDKTFKVLR